MININLTVERKHVYLLATIVVLAAMLIPVNAWASNRFNDVPTSNTFHNDIAWLADAAVTLGCGSGSYCPNDFVTREQMAAFMRRLADNQVVDAKEVNGGTAWMWAQTESPTVGQYVAAEEDYQYNSRGGSITYKRVNVGRYLVNVPGWITGLAHVQVTNFRNNGAHCQYDGWLGPNEAIVSCTDKAGLDTDSSFNVLMFGN